MYCWIVRVPYASEFCGLAYNDGNLHVGRPSDIFVTFERWDTCRRFFHVKGRFVNILKLFRSIPTRKLIHIKSAGRCAAWCGNIITSFNMSIFLSTTSVRFYWNLDYLVVSIWINLRVVMDFIVVRSCKFVPIFRDVMYSDEVICRVKMNTAEYWSYSEFPYQTRGASASDGVSGNQFSVGISRLRSFYSLKRYNKIGRSACIYQLGLFVQTTTSDSQISLYAILLAEIRRAEYIRIYILGTLRYTWFSEFNPMSDW
jgi:hypothetical protein